MKVMHVVGLVMGILVCSINGDIHPTAAPAARGTRFTSYKKSNGIRKSSKVGGLSSGIEGVVIAGIVILFIVVVAIVIYFVIKRRARQRQFRDVEKADTQPSSHLASPKVQGRETLQTFPIANAEAVDTSDSINQTPPPKKNSNEDDFSSKPIVTKKLDTAPMD